MTDDETKTASEDAKPLSLTETYEIAYGMKKFGVSDKRLAEAVRRVGHWPRPSRRRIAEIRNGKSI
jgi:hypothetical protein